MSLNHGSRLQRLYIVEDATLCDYLLACLLANRNQMYLYCVWLQDHLWRQRWLQVSLFYMHESNQRRRIRTHSHTHTCTLWAIKRSYFILDQNSNVSWWTFTLLMPMETGMKTLQRSYKIYNFTLTSSPHYLIKPKARKQYILKSIVTVLYYSQRKNVSKS